MRLLWARRLKREVVGVVEGIRQRMKRAWRVDPGAWASATLKPVLKSTRGEGRLDEVVTTLAGRLAPVLARLDAGPAVLDDSGFANMFQHALCWIAYQEDV